MLFKRYRDDIAGWLLIFCVLLGAHARADDYRLGPGDLLHVSVFDHAELTLDARVSQSGNITFPLIGQIAVAGLSTREAELLLERRLSEGNYLPSPQVSIIVGDYQSQKVAVMGQVTKPGQYSLTSSTQRVLDVLGAAGGVLNDSAADDATLLRSDGSRQVLNLRRLFEGDLTLNLPVNSGDTLFVPKAPQFYIYGEVQHPGAYKLVRDTTLAQAISMGGGLTLRGTERRAIVKRRNAQGKEQEFSLKSSSILQADDVVLIKQSLF